MHIKNKIIQDLWCFLYNTNLSDFIKIYSAKNCQLNSRDLTEWNISSWDIVTNEQASEKQFVVNHVLDRSNLDSCNRSSNAWSDMENSLMCSPKPERVENIPRPQSGPGIKVQPKIQILKTPSKFLENAKQKEIRKTPERSQSTHRDLVRNRFAKLDLVNYKEK